MIRRKAILAAISIAAPCIFSSWAAANTHFTDGAFDANEWTVSATDGTSLNPRSIPRQQFAFDPSNNTGGAVLYVEQSQGGPGGQGDLHQLGSTLNLMYDYTSSPVALPGANANNGSIDVFFEVPNDGDYAIHITGSGFHAFEKPNGVVSPENANGTLLFMDSSGNAVGPWSKFDGSDPDFPEAELQAALTFGSSPNSPVPHLQAEFELSINNPNGPGGGSAGGGGSGLYDPAPAFWSASGKDTNGDPPISSEIFFLQPDGTTLATPAVNGNGDPVAQPSDVPEPASLTALAMGIGATLVRRRNRI